MASMTFDAVLELATHLAPADKLRLIERLAPPRRNHCHHTHAC